MTFGRNEKNIEKKCLEFEEADLRLYCKNQGFTQEETELFVRNSLKNIERTSDEH